MFRKTGLEVHRGIFVEAFNNYKKQLEFHKSSYYKTRIKQSWRNKLFQIIDNLFQPGSTALPSYSSLESLVENFNDFFIGKIQSIRNEIEENAVNHSMQSQSPPLAHEFKLMRVSGSTIENTIQSLSTKTGSLDPLPTYVRKNHVNFLSSVIANIVNQSLSTGEFPSPLKLSHFRPRPKKDNLDKEIFKNYRPVANIPFLSRGIEKVAATQAYNYLETYNLILTMQSAYRKHRSTETTRSVWRTTFWERLTAVNMLY